MKLDLNGHPSSGNDLVRKRGKLGYVKAFLARTDIILKKCGEVLRSADTEAKTKRKGQFEDLERARKALPRRCARAAVCGARI